MSKHSRAAPVPMDDFEPFYVKNDLLWVPYISGGRPRLHTLTPEVAWKGVAYAVKCLTSTGKIVPFTLKAFRERAG